MASVKLIVMGKGGVGKSCLTMRFAHGTYKEDYGATVEDKFIRNCEVNGTNVIAEILDTAGQDQYSALRKFFMPHGDAFILVYDVTNDFSFEEINAFRDQIFRANQRAAELPFVLVANKCDYPDSERIVSNDEAEQLCKVLGEKGGNWHFVEASAKEQINVEKVFETAIGKALELGTANTEGGGTSGVMGAGKKTSIGTKKKKKGFCTLL